MKYLDENNQEGYARTSCDKKDTEVVALQQELNAVKKRLHKLEEERESEKGRGSSGGSTGLFERIAMEHGMCSPKWWKMDIESCRD